MEGNEPKGIFITFEGGDGCGKTTQSATLADAVQATGREVVRLREPGGTAISEKIRAILLDPANSEMCDQCELLLYEAARAQLVGEVIAPALERGAVVICDRFFDSTFAYQASARGIPEETVLTANRLGSCGVSPTRTLVFDIDPQVGFERARKRGEADRLEGEGLEFQKLVRAGYLRLAELESERVRVIDASGTIEEVRALVFDAVSDLGLGIGG